jgi:NDP-sugar pyrophosphorylase family protein
MRAMILAAGLGTRLRPLTNDRPKALVEIGGRTLLEITLTRLRSFGIQDVIVNVHHLPNMIVEYLQAHDNFGMRIEVSREPVLLDTGGGLKKAARFFLPPSGDADDPFVLHNVDVISNIDLRKMVQFHVDHQGLVTLATQDRATSRYLLFDHHLQLCGRRSDGDHQSELVRPAAQVRDLAFCGIHIVSPRLFSLLTEEGAFPIIPAYLRLAGQGETILAFRADEYYWRDLGRPESIQQASEDLSSGVLQQ